VKELYQIKANLRQSGRVNFAPVCQSPQMLIALCQGATLKAGGKLHYSEALCQGTTLVVPQMLQNQRGL